MNLLCSLAGSSRVRSSLAAVACSAAIACSSDGPQPIEPITPPKPELPAGVYELSGISPSLATTDLEPFRQIVGNARFVALGESTHTSRGYYQAKTRLIRFMIEQMGFRAVVFESPWLEALPAARYVASCTGTPEAALAGLFGVWRDQSVRDLLTWLCDYNRTHPADPVTFLGFDVQEPWMSTPALKQFLETAAPAQVTLADPLRRCIGATQTSSAFYFSQEWIDYRDGKRNTPAHEDCIRGITDMESWIAANLASLQQASSQAAVEEARLSLVALRAWEDQLWVPDPGGYQARDYGMAQMIQRLHALHTPGKKTIIWAWNWHIARRYDEVRGWNDNPQQIIPRQGARSMGYFLSEALGADYVPVGLIGHRVFTWSSTTTPPVSSNPLGVEKRLHDLGREYLLVDLRQPLPASFLTAGTVYQVSQEWGDPYRQFSALIFLENSPAMTLLNVGP